jgi:DNA (cytosine-5)-methyltransferase 1
MSCSANDLSTLSLFTGAGGLDLGLEQAGFHSVLCVEKDEDSRETLRQNRPEWRLSTPGDIHQLEPSALLRQAGLKRRQLKLLAAGPPCQPFSKSMYWSTGDAPRLRDPRAKTLQAYLDVVEATLPQVLLLENVKGLAFAGKDEGLRLLERELRKINKEHSTSYVPQIIAINAAHFGVPQMRETVNETSGCTSKTRRRSALSSGSLGAVTVSTTSSSVASAGNCKAAAWTGNGRSSAWVTYRRETVRGSRQETR